jgi:hypothetical protein
MKTLEVAMTVPRRAAPAGPGKPGSGGEGAFPDGAFGSDVRYEDDDAYFYNDRYGVWELRPDWMHPDCVDPRAALDHGTCCKYPVDALVRRALELTEAADQTLGAFDRGEGDCAATARELARLLEPVPGLAAEIQAAIPGGDRTAAAQLLCPVGRLILLGLELAGRPGCPWGCADHGTPDRREELAPLIATLEECDAALWDVILPRPRRRRGA